MLFPTIIIFENKPFNDDSLPSQLVFDFNLRTNDKIGRHEIVQELYDTIYTSRVNLQT